MQESNPPVPEPIYSVAGGNPIPNPAMAPQSSPVPVIPAHPVVMTSPQMASQQMQSVPDAQLKSNPAYPGVPPPSAMDPTQAQDPQPPQLLANGFIYPHELCPVDGQPHKFENKMTTCGLVWAVVCFPCGLICCLNQMENKCVKCGKLGMGPSTPNPQSSNPTPK